MKTLHSIGWARNHKILITPGSFYLPFFVCFECILVTSLSIYQYEVQQNLFHYFKQKEIKLLLLMCELRSCDLEQVKPRVTEKSLVGVMHMHCKVLEKSRGLLPAQVITLLV